MMNRKTIPESTIATIMFDSNRECCVCNKRGDHIHHIDGDSSNNILENLTLLCFDCHHEAEIKGGLKRKLTPKTILRYREHKYKQVRVMRENTLKKFTVPIDGLTSEDLLVISRNAMILLELREIEIDFSRAMPNDKAGVLSKLYKFSEFSNFRVAVDIFDFLKSIAVQTRSPETRSEIISDIHSLILTFFQYPETEDDNDKVIELAKTCIYIAFAITYDACIHLNNLYLAEWGLSIYKYVFIEGKRLKIESLENMVNKSFDDLERNLQRPERNDLGNALRLVKVFREDLGEGGLSFPTLPDDLMRIVDEQERREK